MYLVLLQSDIRVNRSEGIVRSERTCFVIALNRVDLPTLGKPTIPAVKSHESFSNFLYLDEILIFLFFIKHLSWNHNTSLTIFTFNSYICTHANNFKSICSTSMLFFISTISFIPYFGVTTLPQHLLSVLFIGISYVHGLWQFNTFLYKHF